MGSLSFGIPVFLKKLTDEFVKRGHSCYYLSVKNGKDIDGDVSLYNKLNIQAKRIDINADVDWRYNEYLKYSNKDVEDMVELSVLHHKLTHQINKSAQYIKEVKIYLENIRKADEEVGVDLFIVWGMRIRDRVIHHYAKKNNKKIYILEHGYFRPFTLTVDSKGINFENSLPRNREFYESLAIDKKRLSLYLKKPEFAISDQELSSQLNLIAKKHRKYRFYRILFINIKKVLNKKYALKKLIKLSKRKLYSFYSNRLEKKMLAQQNMSVKNIMTNACEYIFVPFQLQTDSQLLLFSPYIKTMRDLVQIVSKTVREYNSKYHTDISVIFKPHPMYKDKDSTLKLKEIVEMIIPFGNSFVTTEYSTNHLISRAAAIITVNSTVGIEALMSGKKVITLGQAFYNIDGIVNHAQSPDELLDVIDRTLKSTRDDSLVEKFLYYIRFEYFFEIYYLSPDQRSIIKLVDYILQNTEGVRFDAKSCETC